MRGQVLGVDRRSGEGQVADDDGRRYAFGPDDWADRGEPRVGAVVDFEARDDRALSLFPLPAVAPAGLPPPLPPTGPARHHRNKYVAALLAFFLGVLGVHRFYLGRGGSGAAMLILSLTGIGLLVSVPWSLVDMLRLLFMADDEFAARYP